MSYLKWDFQLRQSEEIYNTTVTLGWLNVFSSTCFSTISSNKTTLFSKSFKKRQPINKEYSHLHLFFLEKSFKFPSWTPLLFTFPEDRKSSKGWKGSGSLLNTNCKRNALELWGTAFTSSLPATLPTKSPSTIVLSWPGLWAVTTGESCLKKMYRV